MTSEQVYSSILTGQPENYDPWLTDHRAKVPQQHLKHIMLKCDHP